MPNLADTVARVTRLGATASRPAISVADVNSIVASYPLPDAAGLVSSQVGWVPNYDANAAIAEVYAQKAALVAGDFNFTADDASYDKADLLAHMLEMRDMYAAKAYTATGVSAAGAGTINVGGTNAGLTNPLDEIALGVIP